MLRNRIIGPGEYLVSDDPMDLLVAYGLGSCLGIGMYDTRKNIGGLAHVVLPGVINGNVGNSSNYVDFGIQSLVKQMRSVGASTENIIVCLAGGANMLVSISSSNNFDIGSRNIEAALHILEKMNMKIIGQETGGNVGRTIRVYISDGRVTCRVIGGQEVNLNEIITNTSIRM